MLSPFTNAHIQKVEYTVRSLATLCTYSYNNNLVLFICVNIQVQRYHGVITR